MNERAMINKIASIAAGDDVAVSDLDLRDAADYLGILQRGRSKAGYLNRAETIAQIKEAVERQDRTLTRLIPALDDLTRGHLPASNPTTPLPYYEGLSKYMSFMITRFFRSMEPLEPGRSRDILRE
jgi:hypothetical protein